MSLLLSLGRIRSKSRRIVLAIRTSLAGLIIVENNEKSNGFLNIRLVSDLTLKTTIYQSLDENSRIVILTTAFSNIIPYAL